jgi:DNA-binding IclR family transcriptional regulator
MRNSTGGLQSVDRAIRVLEVLAARGEAGVTELAAEIAVHKSTAFRLLGALEGRGLVEQSGQRGKYRLGLGLIPLAGAVSDRLDVIQQGRDVCTRLAIELGETVNVAVLREHFAVNVDQALGPSTVATHNWIGQLTPLHCTSSGKVLLAHLDPAQRAALLARGGTPALTPRTETVAQRLDEQLARVREAGYAMAIEEYEMGLNAVAAPVFDQSGRVIAAVSVSGPSYRLDELHIRHAVAPLLAATTEISRRMGHRLPSP